MMKGKCPFGKVKCEECVLYREGLRYFDDPKKEPVHFQNCAVNIIADSMENMITRTIGQQAAIESLRNEIAVLNGLFFGAINKKELKDKSD